MPSHILPAARRRLPICPIMLFLMLSILFFMNWTQRGAASSALAPNAPASPAALVENPATLAQTIGTCFAPQAISDTGLFSFTNIDTVTGREGQTFAGCNVEGDPRIEHDVWYRWTASCTGPVTIQTCGLTNVDTKIAVYDGGTCPEAAPLTSKGTESRAVAQPLADCNDDECGDQSKVNFQAVAGSQYLIQLGSAPNTPGGNGQFRITCDPAPKVSCCLPGPSCQNIPLAECRERGGFPGGTGSSCPDNTIRPRPVDNRHENVVPLVWQPKHRNWNRDTNQNFVEDDIDLLSRDTRVNIKLALNRVPLKSDLHRFSQVGQIGYVGRYLPVISLKDVRVPDAIALGQDPRVAHVEIEHKAFFTTNVSIQAIRVQGSTTYDPNTMEATPACSNLDGTGVSIAILDSGVDDAGLGSVGVSHDSLPASSFVAGFNAVTGVNENPNDEVGHGTHVAAIALGRKLNVSSFTFRGVAPGAGLVDIQVGTPSLGPVPDAIEAALDKCIEKRIDWNIKVINLSLAFCADSDGTDSFSQHVNQAVAAGMVVVMSMPNASNTPPCQIPVGTRFVPDLAAADKGIAVQIASYENTVNRTNDQLASNFFLTGPRLSDGDLDTADELKPDVTAHGTNSNSGGGVASALFNATNTYVRLPGTSMAAPHVAGLAALALQAKPTMMPLTTKELILDTAEHRGSTLGWQKDWGFGLIDGFAVCEALTQSLQTDLQFITNCSNPVPLNYTSPDVFAGDPIIVEGTPNTINARIHNAGPNTSGSFDVELSVYDFSNGSDLHICTVSVPGMAANQTITVSCLWNPQVSLTIGDVHACLKAYIIYPQDSNTSNDCAQHNVSIKATQSPANFKFNVVNSTNEDLTIRLVHDLNVCASNGWTIHFSTPTFMLRAGDPPRTVEAILDPGAQRTGAQRVAVTAVGVRANGTELSLGGVTLVAQIPGFADCNNNGVADSIDIELGSSKDRDHDGIPDECTLCPSKTITINPATLVDQTWASNVDYPPLNLTPTGGTAPYTFAVTGGATPPGMVVDPYGTLRGKPLTPGTYSFQIKVTDADGCFAMREYRIVILNCPPITLNPAAGALPATALNLAYSQTFTPTGGCSSSFTYSVTGGALPPGLALAANGVLSGTATQDGDFTFTVTATDSCGCSQSQTYTLKVQNLRIGNSGIIISGFRFDGPNGTGDEFVEIVNNTTTAKTIVSSDAGGRDGFSVWGIIVGHSDAGGIVAQKICTIPNSTLLIPGQHYLCARVTPSNVSGYELGNYAQPDFNTFTLQPGSNLAVDGGIALFSSDSVVINGDGTFFSPLGEVFREDAVGFKKKNSDTFDLSFAPAFREGAGLNPIGPQDPASRSSQDHSAVREYSFVRKHQIAANGGWSGPVYNDSNNNSVDFALVSNIGDFNSTAADMDTAPIQAALSGFNFDPSPVGFPGTEASTTPVFGAPGPQNLASPLERNFNTHFLRAAFDTGSAIDVSPNRERNSQIVCGSSRGDLILRFTYKNNTGLAQNNLRVRWVDISTLTRNNPNFTSIIDLLDSTQATRLLFVNNGRDLNIGTSAAAIAAQNDPPVAPSDGSGGNPANDGIVNARPAGGAGEKVVRGTYVEGVNKNPPVVYNGGSFPPFSFVIQNFRQVNPTETDLSSNPGSPCRVGGFNSATVATPPTAAPSPTTTIPNLPATLPVGGSISLEHRFGVIKQGQFLIVGIIESN